MRIIVNPANGSVLCMDSKRLQDLGASNVMLDEVYGILVVIYAWKFIPREGLASIPKSDHDGGLSENIDDSCSESTVREEMYPNVRMNWHTCMSGKTWQRMIPARRRQWWIALRAIILRCLVFRPKNIIERKSSRWPSRPVGRAEMSSNTRAGDGLHEKGMERSH